MSDSAMRTIVPLGTIEFPPQTMQRIETALESDPVSYVDKTTLGFHKFNEDQFNVVFRILLNQGKTLIAKDNPSDGNCITASELWEEICRKRSLEDTSNIYETWNFNLYAALNATRTLLAPQMAAASRQE